MTHYRKLFGQEVSREKNPQRVWFKLAGTKLALEVVAPGQKPGFSHYCVNVAGFDRTSVTAKSREARCEGGDRGRKGYAAVPRPIQLARGIGWRLERQRIVQSPEQAMEGLRPQVLTELNYRTSPKNMECT